jgi:hypothetical protein
LKAATSRKGKYKDKSEINVNEAGYENVSRFIWPHIVYRQKKMKNTHKMYNSLETGRIQR